jgi:hypothetical protein
VSPAGPLQNSVRGELVEPLSFLRREEKAFDELRPNGFCPNGFDNSASFAAALRNAR